MDMNGGDHPLGAVDTALLLQQTTEDALRVQMNEIKEVAEKHKNAMKSRMQDLEAKKVQMEQEAWLQAVDKMIGFVQGVGGGKEEILKKLQEERETAQKGVMGGTV